MVMVFVCVGVVSELAVVACTDSLTTSLLGVLKLLLLFVATHLVLGESMGPVQAIGLAVVLIGMLVYRSSLASSSGSGHGNTSADETAALMSSRDDDEDSEAKEPDRAARARAQAAGKARANAAARTAANEAAAAAAAVDAGVGCTIEFQSSTLKERQIVATANGSTDDHH